MSTIKATNIQHPSAASPNLVLASDGSVSGGAGLGGLVHLRTEEFTAQSSVSVDDCFSADYDSYRIVFNVTASTGSGSMLMRLRSGGTDHTGSNYYWSYIYTSYTGSGSPATLRSGGVVAQWQIGYLNLTYGAVACMDVHKPQLAAYPSFHSASGNMTSDHAYVGGDMNTTTSFDGFTIYPGVTANLTGSVSVYGYANS